MVREIKFVLYRLLTFMKSGWSII